MTGQNGLISIQKISSLHIYKALLSLAKVLNFQIPLFEHNEDEIITIMSKCAYNLEVLHQQNSWTYSFVIATTTIWIAMFMEIVEFIASWIVNFILFI